MQDILLVTNTDASEGFIKELLMNTTYSRILMAYNFSDATNLLDVNRFDLVIINAPMRHELGDRLAKYAAQRTTSSILFIARESTYDQTLEIMHSFGVLAVKKPVPVKPFSQLLKLIENSSKRVAKLYSEGTEVLNIIDQLRTVDVAKWFLIQKYSISESQAHRIVEKYAMDHQLPKNTAAEKIVQGAVIEI